MKGYHQITEEERYTISHLRKLKFTPSQIARQLGQHRSTIVREYKRNGKQGSRVYRPSKAQKQANGRRSRSRKKRQYSTEQLAVVWEYLRRFWSPEQISARLKIDQIDSLPKKCVWPRIKKSPYLGLVITTKPRKIQAKETYGIHQSTIAHAHLQSNQELG